LKIDDRVGFFVLVWRPHMMGVTPDHGEVAGEVNMEPGVSRFSVAIRRGHRSIVQGAQGVQASPLLLGLLLVGCSTRSGVGDGRVEALSRALTSDPSGNVTCELSQIGPNSYSLLNHSTAPYEGGSCSMPCPSGLVPYRSFSTYGFYSDANANYDWVWCHSASEQSAHPPIANQTYASCDFDGSGNCSVLFDNRFGDPWEGCIKDGATQYECVDPAIAWYGGAPACALTQNGNQYSLIARARHPYEGQTCPLTCPPGQVPANITTTYGLESLANASYPQVTCNPAANTGGLLGFDYSTCDGSGQCTVMFDNRFGDPWVGCIKDGTAAWQCVPAPGTCFASCADAVVPRTCSLI
jgi:hypothetical protein